MKQITLYIIDDIIIICYLMSVIGYSTSKRHQQSSEDNSWTVRNLIWPIIDISLFAVSIGSGMLIGLKADPFLKSIIIYNEWMTALVFIISALFMMAFYLNSKVYTMPEFLERKLHPFTELSTNYHILKPILPEYDCEIKELNTSLWYKNYRRVNFLLLLNPSF